MKSMQKNSFKLKSFISDKFNNKRASIYFVNRPQGIPESPIVEDQNPLSLNVKATCFMSNQMQHMTGSYNRCNTLDLRSLIFFCFLSFAENLKKVPMNELLPLEDYYRLYFLLTNHLQIKKINWSTSLIDTDLIYSSFKTEKEYKSFVRNIYNDLWIFDNLKDLDKKKIKIGSAFVNQTLTLKYSNVCEHHINGHGQALKYIRVNPSDEIKIFKHRI